MLDRRRFLQSASAALLLGACRAPRPPGAAAEWVNDVHSQLNRTRVARVVRPATVHEVRALVRAGEPLAIAGGRHAMGGQQFASDAPLVDTRGLDRVLSFDAERGLLQVEAGIQWPAVLAACEELQRGHARPFGIAQKQTGADRLCLGGALSANVHGRGLTLPPFVADVESFRLVAADGELHDVSRTSEPELFRLAVGGYGLFGLVTDLTLRLVPRTRLERVVEVIGRDALAAAFAQRIAAGFTYGDFQFDVDPESEGFLHRGVFACYRPADPDAPLPPRRELSDSDWVALLQLVHEDPHSAFERYADFYLSTNGQLYHSDTQQLGFYPDGYHAALDAAAGGKPASEVITELYVPLAQIAPFLADVALALRERQVPVVYGTIRLIERDAETFLPWASQPWACTVLNLHVEHDQGGLQRAADAFRALIDLAQARGGSFFLTYHRHASRAQVLASYPQMPAFLEAKRSHDPRELFTSDWYRHMTALVG